MVFKLVLQSFGQEVSSHNKKFNATQKFLRYRITPVFDDSPDPLTTEDIADELERVLNELIARACGPEVDDNDQVQITIDHQEILPIHMRFRKFRDLSAQDIAAEMLKVNQSKRGFIVHGVL